MSPQVALTPGQGRSLAQFFSVCMAEAFDGILESAETQDHALALGLLVESTATEDECAHGFAGEPGDTIYRIPGWITQCALQGDSQ